VVFVVLALAARSATKELPDDVSSLPPVIPPTASAWAPIWSRSAATRTLSP